MKHTYTVDGLINGAAYIRVGLKPGGLKSGILRYCIVLYGMYGMVWYGMVLYVNGAEFTNVMMIDKID